MKAFVSYWIYLFVKVIDSALSGYRIIILTWNYEYNKSPNYITLLTHMINITVFLINNFGRITIKQDCVYLQLAYQHQSMSLLLLLSMWCFCIVCNFSATWRFATPTVHKVTKTRSKGARKNHNLKMEDFIEENSIIIKNNTKTTSLVTCFNVWWLWGIPN